MNHKDLYNLLQTVKKNIRCPQCGKEYDFKQIRIRGIAEFIVFLELHCTSHMPVLATVALSKNLLDGSGSLNDATQVNSNDVLDAYHALEKFRGGFDKLFTEKNKK